MIVKDIQDKCYGIKMYVHHDKEDMNELCFIRYDYMVHMNKDGLWELKIQKNENGAIIITLIDSYVYLEDALVALCEATDSK